jgi:hypothetical protein
MALDPTQSSASPTPPPFIPPQYAPEPARAPAHSDSARPPGAKNAASSRKEPLRDPIEETLARLKDELPRIAAFHAGLAARVESLAREGDTSMRRAQTSFRHEVAYAVQDFERAGLGRLPGDNAARVELGRLAGSAPGLENDAMLELMRATGGIKDNKLVALIRDEGRKIGQLGNQNSPEIQSRIDALANQARLAPRSPDPDAGLSGGTPGADKRPSSNPSGPVPPDRGPEDPTKFRPSFTDAQRQAGEPARNGAQQPGIQGHMPMTMQRRVIDTVLDSMRGPNTAGRAPWDPLPTPLGERLTTFQRKMLDGHDDITLRAAEKSGRAALQALEAFRSGPGATVMNRIAEAARNNPGGMEGVLSEMREGGRFADLRRQFGSALATEQGMAAAYDKAAAAIAVYGQNRALADQVIARKPDADNITAKFEQMDKEIGEAAGKTPSRRDGKTMIDDLATKAAEMFRHAVRAVKSLVNRGPTIGPDGPGAGPA